MTKAIILKSVAILIGIALAATAAAEPAPGAETPARLRLFGQNGIGVMFYRNSTCYKMGFLGPYGGESVSGGLVDAFSSFIGKANNTVIGMPETVNTKMQNEKDGILSKAYYKEYTVKPDESLTIFTALGDASGFHCGPIAFSFTPKAGADYEGFLEVNWKEKICRFNLNEIVKSDQSTDLVSVNTAYRSSRCE